METPNPFPNILVGIDPEGRSRHAVLRALELREKLGSRVSLIHAVEIPPPMWPGIREKELAQMHAAALSHGREESVRMLEPIAREAGVPLRDLEDHLSIAPGPAAKVILDHLSQATVDLILLGPHEKRSLFDFGSTGRAVLARTNTPVWTQVEKPDPIEKILVAYDFSEHSKRALDHARVLAELMEAGLDVLHCYVPPAFAYSTASSSIPGPTYVVDQERQKVKDEFEKQMKEYDFGSVSGNTVFLEGNPTDVILERAKVADLLVMGSHGRTGLSRFLLGSVAYGCLKRSESPVMVVPSPSQTWLLSESENSDKTEIVV